MHGVLKHHYRARHLEKAPNGILAAIADNPAVVTLRAAAKAISRNHTGSSRAHCNCKTTCNTRRCGCFKSIRTFIVHCQPRGTGVCCNKAGAASEGAASEGAEADDSNVE